MQARPILKTGRLIKNESRLQRTNDSMTVGLRKRPTFEGIVDYIANGQETIKYPDRLAKFMRNHPYLTQLDGEGIMEMQDQQEEAWKAEEKEHRMKLLKTQRSAPEMRATRDASSSAQIIPDEDWDDMIRQASHVIPAESRCIQNQYNRDEQRNNISQTMNYELGRLGRASDVVHAMPDEEDDDEIMYGRSESSSTGNVGGSSSSSSGAGRTLVRTIGRAAKMGGTALSYTWPVVKFGGKATWETLKFGGRVVRGVSTAMKPFTRMMEESALENERQRLSRRNRSRSSTRSRAERSVSIPPEAPDSDVAQYFSIATPRRSQSRPRAPPPLPPPVRGRGRSPQFATRVGPDVRDRATRMMRAFSGGIADI